MVYLSLREIVERLGREVAAEITAVTLWVPTLRITSRNHGAARRATTTERFAVSFPLALNNLARAPESAILAGDKALSSNRASPMRC